MIGNISSVSIQRKCYYWEDRVLRCWSTADTTHNCLCLHTNPRCEEQTQEQLPGLHKSCEHGQNHLRAQTSPRTGGCATNRGCGRHTKLWRSICFSLCVVQMITLACLKIQGGDVSSIITSSVSDKSNS